MEVIIYADSLFMLSFLYNMFLFWLIKAVFYHNCRFFKVIGAALCGAAIDTLSPLLQIIMGEGVKPVFVFLILPVISVFFREKRMKKIFSVWVSYIFLSFFLAGLCQLVFFDDSKKIKLIELLAVLPAGIVFARVACNEYKKYRLKRPFIYKVRLKQGTKIIETMGFYDTGNGLFEPSGVKPVVLVDRGLYEELFGPDSIDYKIPYTAVGTTAGSLEGNELEAIYIDADGGIVSEKIVAAKASNILSPEGYYRVILHPELFIKNQGGII